MSNAVDPHQLLKALGPLLTPDGAMKNDNQVPRIACLMDKARKLVSRCIYVNILRATTEEQLLRSFVTKGGWELLNTWLQEAKDSNNIAFLTDLLKTLRKLPVTIDVLKKNNTAKLIKHMSKSEADERLKSLAEDVVSEWMKVIKQTHENTDIKPASTSSVGKKKKKLVKKVSSKGEPDKDDGDDNGGPAAKKLKVEQDGTTKSENNHERTKKGNNRKIELDAKGSLSPQGKSPKSEKPSKVVKEEVRPRTAKIKRPAHAKFRSTGLEKASTLPPIKIKKKKPAEPPPVIIKGDKGQPVKREGPIFGKSLLPPEKKPKLDTSTSSTSTKTLSTSSSSMSTSTSSTSTSSSSASNNHGKAKPVPAKHKQVHESSNFMDALNAPAIPVRKVKIKKQPKPSSPTTNKETKPDPPKFRFYSSGQNDEDNAEKTEGKDDANSDAAKNSATTGNLKLIPSKSKKCVKWREEEKLVDIFYFEMDETERENVNRPKDFRNAAHLEIVMEREAMKNAKLHGEGAIPITGSNDLLPWRTPVHIQVLDVPPVDYGVNSVEKGIQKQREMIVLQEIYFDKKMIPDTPKEPDPEPFEPKEPTRIPLEDETKRKPDDNETAESSQGSTPLYSEPMLTGNPSSAPQPPLLQGGIPRGITLPPGLQLDNLPPAIASLVQQIPGGHSPLIQHGPPGQPMPGPGRPNEPPSTNATIANVQNLLDSIMGNQQGGAQPTQEELTNKLRDMLEPFKNQLPGTLGPPQPSHPGAPNFNPDGWGPRGPGGPGPGHGPSPGHGPGPGMGPGPGPGPIRGRGGMGPHFGGPGRGGFSPRFNGPPFPNGPPRFPGPGGPDMGPRGPPRPLLRGMWGRGGGRGRGAINFAARPVCRHFMTPRGCERAQTCQFYHPGVNGPPLTE